jgi:hypothetical protein
MKTPAHSETLARPRSGQKRLKGTTLGKRLAIASKRNVEGERTGQVVQTVLQLGQRLIFTWQLGQMVYKTSHLPTNRYSH